MVSQARGNFSKSGTRLIELQGNYAGITSRLIPTYSSRFACVCDESSSGGKSAFALLTVLNISGAPMLNFACSTVDSLDSFLSVFLVSDGQEYCEIIFFGVQRGRSFDTYLRTLS